MKIAGDRIELTPQEYFEIPTLPWYVNWYPAEEDDCKLIHYNDERPLYVLVSNHDPEFDEERDRAPRLSSAFYKVQIIKKWSVLNVWKSKWRLRRTFAYELRPVIKIKCRSRNWEKLRAEFE